MTTKALSKIVAQKPSAIGMLMEIGHDVNRAANLGDPKALLQAAQVELQVPATRKEIETTIDVLAHSIKWQGEDCVLDPDPFLSAMLRALQRAEFPRAVLAEAAERLIASERWFPA